jgi:hypothetical protein
VNKLTIGASKTLAHMRKGAKLHRGFADKIELRFTDGLSFGVPMQTFDSLIDERRIVSENGAPSVFVGWHERHIKAALLQGEPLNPSEECCERSIKHSNSPSLNSHAPSSGGLSAPLGLIVADCEFQSATGGLFARRP